MVMTAKKSFGATWELDNGTNFLFYHNDTLNNWLGAAKNAKMTENSEIFAFILVRLLFLGVSCLLRLSGDKFSTLQDSQAYFLPFNGSSTNLREISLFTRHLKAHIVS